MKFSELDERAKRRARDDSRDRNVDHDWWDYTYEDARRIGALLGIDIQNHRKFPDIEFDIDCGTITVPFYYNYSPKAVQSIAEYAPKDAELNSLAVDFTMLQHAVRLTTGGRLFGSNTRSHVQVDVVDVPGEAPPPTEFQENALEALFKRFENWLLTCLTEEYEYLTSDECLDQYLAEEEFDEDGSMI